MNRFATPTTLSGRAVPPTRFEYRIKRSITIDPTVGSLSNCFAGVSGGCFTWRSVESVLHDDDVRSGRTTDTIRVPDLKVHNYRSDHWIALKLFPRVSGGCFTWSSVESVCHADDAVRSVHTRVPDEKVHNYRYDRWIALKLFSRVFECCFTWSSVEPVCHANDAGRSAHTRPRPEYRMKRSKTIDSTVGSL